MSGLRSSRVRVFSSYMWLGARVSVRARLRVRVRVRARVRVVSCYI